MATPFRKFIGGPKNQKSTNAPNVPPMLWAQYKDPIIHYYLVLNWRLRFLVQHLKREAGFESLTERQLTHKLKTWNCRKKVVAPSASKEPIGRISRVITRDAQSPIHDVETRIDTSTNLPRNLHVPRVLRIHDRDDGYFPWRLRQDSLKLSSSRSFLGFDPTGADPSRRLLTSSSLADFFLTDFSVGCSSSSATSEPELDVPSTVSHATTQTLPSDPTLPAFAVDQDDYDATMALMTVTNDGLGLGERIVTPDLRQAAELDLPESPGEDAESMFMGEGRILNFGMMDCYGLWSTPT